MVTFTQIRARIDSCNAHLPHVSRDRFAIDAHAFTLQLRRNLAGTVKGTLRVEFINAMVELHFLGDFEAAAGNISSRDSDPAARLADSMEVPALLAQSGQLVPPDSKL